MAGIWEVIVNFKTSGVCVCVCVGGGGGGGEVFMMVL